MSASTTTQRAAYVVQESGGFNPRGKYHLSLERLGEALCGAQPRMSNRWNCSGDRVGFEEHAPHRICENCRKAERREAEAEGMAQYRAHMRHCERVREDIANMA